MLQGYPENELVSYSAVIELVAYLGRPHRIAAVLLSNMSLSALHVHSTALPSASSRVVRQRLSVAHGAAPSSHEKSRLFMIEGCARGVCSMKSGLSERLQLTLPANSARAPKFAWNKPVCLLSYVQECYNTVRRFGHRNVVCVSDRP